MQRAMFASACDICLEKHIKEGDWIVKHQRGWAAPGCVEAYERTQGLHQHLVEQMCLRGVACGIPKAGSDLKVTGSYEEFYTLAMEAGLISKEQYRDLYRSHAGMWNSSLLD